MHSLISRLLLSSLLIVWLIAGLTACGYDDPPENTQVSPAVQKRFSRLDRDQDGRLTPDELNRPAIFQAADRNRDGYISLQEAGDYVQQRAARRRPDAPSSRSAVASLPEDSPSATLTDPVSMQRNTGSPYNTGRSNRRKVAANGYSAGDEQYDDSSYDDQTDPSSYPEPRTTVAAPSPRMRLARTPNYDGVDAADTDTNGVQKFLNLPYATIAGVDPNLLSLDVYTPVNGNNHPVIVMIHGGGWRRGDKANPNSGIEKAQFFVPKGYVYVSINYRLSPSVKHPAHVQDVARALVWVYDNINKYSGSPNKIYLMGHSAGAHLTALVSTNEKYLKALNKNLDIIKGAILIDTAAYSLTEEYDGTEKGYRRKILYENAFGLNRKLWQDASPVYHIAPNKGIPRFLIFTQSKLGFRKNLSDDFANKLNGSGIPAKVVLVPEKSHREMNSDVSVSGDILSTKILDFAK